MIKPTLSPQSVRDALLGAFLVFSFVMFWRGLEHYLSTLSNPAPMEFVFTVSLVVAAVYEIKGTNFRQAMIASLVLAIIFASVPWLAQIYREWYLLAIVQLREVEAEAGAAIGVEYIRALDNTAVGIGACYGMALASIRLPFKGLLTRVVICLFLTEVVEPFCAHCGQKVES